MAQKTLTVNGKRYTGKQVSRLMDENAMTVGEDYIIYLNGSKFFANYRQEQDSFWAPVCDKEDATAISLTSDNNPHYWSIWLSL